MKIISTWNKKGEIRELRLFREYIRGFGVSKCIHMAYYNSRNHLCSVHLKHHCHIHCQSVELIKLAGQLSISQFEIVGKNGGPDVFLSFEESLNLNEN